MKTLYLECNMGAAGDMLMAALLELTDDKQAFIDKMNALGLPGVRVCAEKSEKCGITGTHMNVTVDGEEEESLDEHEHHHEHDHEHDHEHHHNHEHHEHGHDHDHEHDHDHAHHHHHTSVADIGGIIDGLDVPQKVKEDAKAVYAIIAEAESQVHGKSVDQIHFHEVGTLDAVADVVGVCLLMNQLGAQKVCASPIHVGSGSVRCAHGVLPVPTPATALILSGLPTYGGQIRGELCTPTGAALLKHFVSEFGDRPLMRTSAIGYGMGKKDFERANCVRAFLGESDLSAVQVTRLECNIDDMTGEEVGFAMETLFAAGAYDVYTQPIGMKKSRPGVMLSVICEPAEAGSFAEIIFKHTSTLGIRRQDMSRYILKRSIETVKTPCGDVRVKTAEGAGVKRQKPEYEDIARIARENDLSLGEVRRMIKWFPPF